MIFCLKWTGFLILQKRDFFSKLNIFLKNGAILADFVTVFYVKNQWTKWRKFVFFFFSWIIWNYIFEVIQQIDLLLVSIAINPTKMHPPYILTFKLTIPLPRGLTYVLNAVPLLWNQTIWKGILIQHTGKSKPSNVVFVIWCLVTSIKLK